MIREISRLKPGNFPCQRIPIQVIFEVLINFASHHLKPILGMIKSKLFAATFCFLATLLFVTACLKPNHEKEHPHAFDLERFFAYKSDLDPVVVATIEGLKYKNGKKEFASRMVKAAGYPLWNKSVISSTVATRPDLQERALSEGDTTYIYTPFVSEQYENVQAVLITRIDNTAEDTAYKFLLANDYADYPRDIQSEAGTGATATNVAELFFYFEITVFDKTAMKIKDHRKLFHFNLTNDSVYVTREVLLNRVICVSTPGEWVWVSQRVVGAPVSEVENENGGYTFGMSRPIHFVVTKKVHMWKPPIFVCYGDPETPPIPSDEYGGGAGGPIDGLDTPNDPHPFDSDPDDGRLDEQGQLEVFEGWEPITIDEPEFNPYAADVVVVDTSISNNFPCVQKIVDSLAAYANLNALAQVALHTVFGVNQNINLTLTVEPTYGENDKDGETQVDSLLTTASAFHATIKLNPWVLTHSTQEYVAAVIIHESVHAYIDYKKSQYEAGLIDSNQFKALFPIYWPPKVLYTANNMNYYNLGGTTHHRVMAANLINIMSEPLKALYPNPSIPTAMRDSIYRGISWGGLDQTTVWRARSDTFDLGAILMMARDTSLHAPFPVILGSNTSPSNYNFDSHTLNMKKGCND